VHRDLIRCSGCRGRVTAPGPDYFRTLDLASYAVSGDVVVPLLGRAERRSRSPAVCRVGLRADWLPSGVVLQLVRRGIAKPIAPARRSTSPGDLLLPIPWRFAGNLAIEQR
jgi:hypothetical protein